MRSQVFLRRSLAAAALLLVGRVAQAAVTAYSSQAALLSAVGPSGVDTYTGLSITGSTATPIVRSAGAFGYTASAPGDFFGAGTTANPWLSTNVTSDAITFYGFTGGVSAVGGNFLGSNIAGAFAAGSVMLSAIDSLGATSTQTITGATTSSFLGFVSNGAMTSVVLSSVQPSSGFLWPTADNLILAAAVPEPKTYAMMLAGLGLMGFMVRRRRG